MCRMLDVGSLILNVRCFQISNDDYKKSDVIRYLKVFLLIIVSLNRIHEFATHSHGLWLFVMFGELLIQRKCVAVKISRRYRVVNY